jgi:hypothetical protein
MAIIGVVYIIQILTCAGMLKSRISISRDRRFRIRPIGVVSKKLMGEWKMRDRRFEWRARDALMKDSARQTDAAMLVITANGWTVALYIIQQIYKRFPQSGKTLRVFNN